MCRTIFWTVRMIRFSYQKKGGSYMNFESFVLKYMETKKEYISLVEWLLTNCLPQEDAQPLLEVQD